MKVGSSAVIEIPFSSSPQPEVTWSYKNGRLPDSRRFKEDEIYGMTSLSMSKLQRSDTGDYSLKLENQYGECKFSFKLIVLDRPSPPQDLKVTDVSETSMTLKWSEPESDGGSDVTVYYVETRESFRHSWHRVGTIPATDRKEFKVTHLTQGQQCMFHVAAENEIGMGDFAELKQAVTAKSQFGK